MTTKIQKWGNSLAVRLPIEVVKKLKLHEGSPVTIVQKSKSLSIKPVEVYSYNLKILVKGINPSNRQTIIDWGKKKGKEVW